MRVTNRNRSTPVLVASASLALLLGYGGASWAGDPASAESDAQLKSEVNELKQEVQELKNAIGTMQKQTAVAAPAAPAGQTAAPAPQTVGEHVGALEKDLSDIKKNLNDNLGVHIHGLADVTYEYNFDRPNTSGGSKGGPNATAPGGRVNQLRVFDTNASGWDLEQFNLHVDKSADGGVGFVSDINFGQVANVLRASTRNSNINPATTANDIVDITQAYLTYTAPLGTGINLSLGRFVTLLGEEVIPVYNNLNFNESRSLLFGFAVPFTHTGLRAQYSVNDKVGFTLGVNNGWDDISDNNDGQSVEGQLSLNPNGPLSFVLSGIYGPEQVNHGNSTRWVIDPILTWKTPITGLQLVGEYVYGSEGQPVSTTPAYSSHGNSLVNFPAGPQGTVNITHTVSWTGAAGYIVYDLNDNIEFATRGEWFRDSDGARTGLRQTLGEVTETLNYKVPGVTGLLARLEYRHDESNQKPFFTNTLLPPTAANIAAGVAGLPAHTWSGQDTLLFAAAYSF
jgi:hypothetical protein